MSKQKAIKEEIFAKNALIIGAFRNDFDELFIVYSYKETEDDDPSRYMIGHETDWEPVKLTQGGRHWHQKYMPSREEFLVSESEKDKLKQMIIEWNNSG